MDVRYNRTVLGVGLMAILWVPASGAAEESATQAIQDKRAKSAAFQKKWKIQKRAAKAPAHHTGPRATKPQGQWVQARIEGVSDRRLILSQRLSNPEILRLKQVGYKEGRCGHRTVSTQQRTVCHVYPIGVGLKDAQIKQAMAQDRLSLWLAPDARGRLEVQKVRFP